MKTIIKTKIVSINTSEISGMKKKQTKIASVAFVCRRVRSTTSTYAYRLRTKRNVFFSYDSRRIVFFNSKLLRGEMFSPFILSLLSQSSNPVVYKYICVYKDNGNKNIIYFIAPEGSVSWPNYWGRQWRRDRKPFSCVFALVYFIYNITTTSRVVLRTRWRFTVLARDQNKCRSRRLITVDGTRSLPPRPWNATKLKKYFYIYFLKKKNLLFIFFFVFYEPTENESLCWRGDTNEGKSAERNILWGG